MEPDPAEVTMYLTAQLLTLMVNVHRDTKRHPRPYSVDDFMPQLAEAKPVNDAEGMRKFNETLEEMRANYAARKMLN